MKKNRQENNRRIRKAAGAVKRDGAEAFLVSDRNDIRYLTGFYSERVMVLLMSRGRSVYLVDKMNGALAEKMLDGINIDVSAGPLFQKLGDILIERGIKRLLIDEDDLTVSVYNGLLKKNRKLEFKKGAGFLSKLRAVKDGKEINTLRKAAHETMRIWKKVERRISPGMTEKEITKMIELEIMSGGFERSFPIIAAAGKNSAYPHAVPGDRKLHKGEHILVDFGIVLNGYCSDLTRTWAKGRINRKIKELEKHVTIAHEKAIKRTRAGVCAGSLVRLVNKHFIDNGLGDYILHSLGHGVGLQIHEPPFLREASKVKLKKGMVVTIEPGLYMPGFGGIRKEDMVLVKEKGCEVLTR